MPKRQGNKRPPTEGDEATEGAGSSSLATCDADSQFGPRRRMKKKTGDDCDVICSTMTSSLELRAASYGLTVVTFLQLAACGLPIAFFNILYCLHRSKPIDVTDVDFVEWYSGVGVIRDELLRRGYTAVGFDINEHHHFENFVSAAGMLTAMQLFRRLRSHGGQSWATVCSSWIWMSRSSTLRSDAFPLGFPGRPQGKSVQNGNTMVSNMAVFLYWALSKQSTWIIEQPGTSLMWEHPRLKQLRRWMDSHADPTNYKYSTVTTSMGAFGAATVKPSALHGSSPWVLDLGRSLTTQQREAIRAESTEEVSIKDSETGAVTGGDDLKGTQEYPPGYGVAVSDAWEKWLRGPDFVPDVQDSVGHAEMPEIYAAWPDTSLKDVCDLLKVPWDKLIG